MFGIVADATDHVKTSYKKVSIIAELSSSVGTKNSYFLYTYTSRQPIVREIQANKSNLFPNLGQRLANMKPIGVQNENLTVVRHVVINHLGR
jgi:hypothetical protein